MVNNTATNSDRGQVVSRRARNKAAVRERLVTAALDLFLRKGIEGTTVEAVTRAAGVAKGTFFNYFDSKIHVLVEHYGHLVEEVHAYAEGLPRAPARRWFDRLYGRLARVMTGAPLLARVVLGHHAHPVVRDMENRSWDQGRALMLAVLEEARRRGEIDRRTDPELAAKLLSAIWTATLSEWIATQPSFQLEPEVRRRLRVVWDGIAAR